MAKISAWRKNPKAIKKYTFLHHFLPLQSGNRALLLGAKYLVLYIALSIFTFGGLKVVPKIAPGVLGYASEISTSELLTMTNSKRIEKGLGILVLNNDLSKAAEGKAKHMFANNYWAHIAPDGTTPWDFILSENYDYIYAGENLAKNFNTSKQVVEAWYESPTHRENLLNKNYTEVGFAVVNGELDGYETTLVVQMFGKPRVAGAAAVNDDAASVSANDTSGVKNVIDNANLITDTNPAPVILNPDKLRELTNIEFTAPRGNSRFFDVGQTSLTLNLVIIGFVLTLLIIDVWYSSRAGAIRLTGNTWVHLLFFVLAAFGVWVVLAPGKIL